MIVRLLPPRCFRVVPTSRHVHTSNLSNPTLLRRKNVNVHLLGTMHIAQASATAARQLIQREHAKGTLGAVFLELDEARNARLAKASSQTSDQSLFSLAMSTFSNPNTSPLSALIQLAFKSMYRMLHQLGFASGVEFSAAIQEASRLNVPVILGDQHISKTMAKLADAFRADFDLSRLMALALANPPIGVTTEHETQFERGMREAFQAMAAGNVEQAQARLEKLIHPQSVHRIVRPMATWLPSVTDVLLHQRDTVMVRNLIKAADSLPPDKDTIVAIVGLAHMHGIVQEWERRHGSSALNAAQSPS